MNINVTRLAKRARQFSQISALCALALLSACGGGGDTPAPAPVPVPVPVPVPAPPAISQENATLFTKLAGTSQIVYQQLATNHMVFAAGYMQGLSTIAGGSVSPISQACPQGGSFILGVTKAGSYTGFRSGDKVTTSFNRCYFGTTRLDGALSLTPSATYTNLPAGNFSVALNVLTDNFRIDTSGGYSASTNGSVTLSMTVSTAASGGVSYSAQVTAPGSYVFSLFTSVASTTPSLTLTSTGLSSVTAASPTLFNISNNMSVAYSSTTGSTFGYTLTTTSALSGPISTSSAYIPNTGTFRLTNITGFPSTIVTVSVAGSVVTVAVDTNGDGVTDYSFTLTAASLVSG